MKQEADSRDKTSHNDKSDLRFTKINTRGDRATVTTEEKVVLHSARWLNRDQAMRPPAVYDSRTLSKES